MGRKELLNNDTPVSQLADRYWPDKVSPGEENAVHPSMTALIDEIYDRHLKGHWNDHRLLLSFELTRYLENFLWPLFTTETESVKHILSIVLMINTKFRERVSPWDAFIDDPQHFPSLFHRVSHLILDTETSIVSIDERTTLLIFLSHTLNSIEKEIIRSEVQKVISLPMWISLSEKRRESEFQSAPKLRRFWNLITKKDKSLDAVQLDRVMFERRFLLNLIKLFMKILESIPSSEESPSLDGKQRKKVFFCEKFLELLVDIESLLPTRRFFNALLDDMHVIISCRKSPLFRRKEEGRLFRQMLDVLIFYVRFEIDDLSGDALSPKEVALRHTKKIFDLQKHIFQELHEEMKAFYLSSIGSISKRDQLMKHFASLSPEQLMQLCVSLGLISNNEGNSQDKDILLEMIAFSFEKYSSQLETLNELPLYPTEEIIWDDNLVPSEFSWSGDQVLALPKLNLQFLTLHDYLLRNFHLFRLESTYEIRQDIEDAIYRVKPWRREDGGILFGGWARMALAIDSMTVVEVKKPNIGEKHPSRVRAEIRINLNVKRDVKREWESLRKHDVCFLVSLDPPSKPGTFFKYNEPFIPQVGLKYVRGCEIEGMLDPTGKVIEEGFNQEGPLTYDTDYRTYRVWLDPCQYAVDAEKFSLLGDEDNFYDGMNVIIRRKPEENNFKAVLETIRDLMNSRCVVPDWIHDVLLGFGDPAAANYRQLDSRLSELDFNDTFIDDDHLKMSFPEKKVIIEEKGLVGNKTKRRPFRLKFVDESTIVAIPYTIPNRGPYDFVQPKLNAVPFTPTQVEAIHSGMQPGLTVIVGPPGTGKTDVAVQIINNIYHNFPNQRTLLVTHSNQALNQLFEKIMKLDIDERHLLRLGHGEEALETEKDFTRYGRVNYVLRKRLELLQEVQRLALSLGLPPDAGHTCETAGYFFHYHVYSRWEKFLSCLKPENGRQQLSESFPFLSFFANATQPLFKGDSFESDLEIARGCFRYIKKIFTQLEEFKPFEMIRTGGERSRYLLVKEAKIIAMTCTHAALRRKELVELGFQYDNILMEEAGQILEIETFIPLLLQNPEHGHNRLKRWIMIGDHHQLPPVIKNVAFQKYSNMEQSLFTRFVRLGVPTLDLDAQGRARPSLCDLYRWRYNQLGDLPSILQHDYFKKGNPGLAFDYQLIDVPDLNGVGESEPVPHFFQNLAEAEYAVSLFMFMRLIGYPASSISILTTYNGQKSLIKDVINQRCASNPFIGVPSKVTTVDKFQGQQNDYIILSLVRTKTVGHLRDVRRLVVAVSRARLGLYIFGRVSLFGKCFELKKTFEQLMRRPQQLAIIPTEEYPETERKVDESLPDSSVQFISSLPEMMDFVYKFYATKIEEWQKTKPEFVREVLKQSIGDQKMEGNDTEVVEESSQGPAETKYEEEIGFEPIGEDDTGDIDPDPEIPMEDD